MNVLVSLSRPCVFLLLPLCVWAGCNGSTYLITEGGESTAPITLFDGTSVSGWRMAGPGTFELQPDGSLQTRGGMGLFYFAERSFRDFELELEWKAETASSNSGVFVRFPETDDPWVAVREGHEIQIHDASDPLHRTGAIYDTASSWRLASRPPGEWNSMRIRVAGQRYQVWVNGEQVNDFISNRAREGHVGLQNHGADDTVWFRNIRVVPLPDAFTYAPESLAELFSLEGQYAPISVLMITATHGFRHDDAIETSIRVLEELSLTTEFEFDVMEDLSVLTPDLLEPYDLIFFNNSTLRLDGGADGLPVTEAQREAILGFLADGKGVVGAHAAADAFYGWDAYREMLGGGLFETHPWTQSVRIAVEDPDNPATAHFGNGFWIRDEIYVLDENPRWNAHVLLSLDMTSVGIDPGPADFTRNDYPISWIRRHNGGRVFYTKLGHFPDVWTNPGFLQHLLQGMRMAAGRLETNLGGRRVKEVVSENLWPADLAVDARGNVWIAELRGRIHHYDAQSGVTREIAHIRTTDPTNIEHGLYGLEVDPAFYDGQPFVYVYYAEPETFINTLSRFTYRDGALDPGSEQVLLRVPTEPFCCHQAGDLEWGPDSTLYLSTGDTGQSTAVPEWRISEERLKAFMERNKLSDYHWVRLADSERTAQNLQDLRGKVLRINRDGSIPRDNPFYGRPGIRWEIYAYGLRNPYRFKVDPVTNHVYIGVVGPDGPTDYDEYNVSLKGGENFGWPRETGRLLFNEWTPEDIPDWAPSMWEYTYEAGGRSATVGAFYRSDGEYAFPRQFQERLFIFDWSRRWIKWADVVEDGWVADTAASVVADPVAHRTPARRLKNIRTFDMLWETQPISMEVAPDGSIYVAEFTGFWDAAPGARVTRYRWVREEEGR